MHVRRSTQHGLTAAALAAALCLLAMACRPAAREGVALDLAWRVIPDPPRVGPVRLELTLTDPATGRPAAGARVRVEANMSHPGMRPVFAVAHEEGAGRYLAPVELSMAGDWFLLLEADLPDARTWRGKIDLPGVRSQ